MELIRENCLEDGLSEAEINIMEEYPCDKPGDNNMCLVYLADRPRMVCQTVAEALELVRPGCWVRGVYQKGGRA